MTWIHGDARCLPPVQVDLVTMTGNVAQAIAEPADWDATLRGAHSALRPGGHLVFETRDPTFRGWTEWNRSATRRTVDVDGIGPVEHWVDVTGSSPDDRMTTAKEDETARTGHGVDGAMGPRVVPAIRLR